MIGASLAMISLSRAAQAASSFAVSVMVVFFLIAALTQPTFSWETSGALSAIVVPSKRGWMRV